MGYPREELEEMWQRWLDANAHAENTGDWTRMSDLFAEDAHYGWMITPDDYFMAIGREQIREWALGAEMLGFEGWQYPYVTQLIDEKAGMIMGFWRQLSDKTDPDTGEPYEMVGLGGSWFGYGGNYQWAWQRDFFEVGSAGATMMKMIKDGNASPTLLERISIPPDEQVGHYSAADLPAPLWPIPTPGRR